MVKIHDCYLDDSKDERQEIAYVCAGFYGTEEVWLHFTKAWRKQLRDEGIEYFKSSECNSLSGQFERWRKLPAPFGHQAAQLIKQRLADVARSLSGLHAVGVALPVEEFEAVLKHENAREVFPEEHIYHRVFETALLAATKSACTTPRDLMVFVHDDGPDFGQLFAIFKDFKVKNPNAGKRLTSFLSMDDTKTPALQLADLFANSVQRMTVGLLDGDRSRLDDFMFDRSGLKVWTRELGESALAHNLRKRGFSVPQSLDDAIASHDQHPKRYPIKSRTRVRGPKA